MTARALLGVVLLVAGCRDLSGAAVLVTTETMGLEVDQLRYEGTLDGGSAFRPAVRPELSAGLTPSSSTVRILLSHDMSDQLLDVRVVGLRLGVEQAEGTGRVLLAAGVERLVTIRLVQQAVTCRDCPGCCSASGACLSPSPAACGSAGAACTTCDTLTADTCGADGRCRCGAGAPCSDVTGADRCVAGVCRCGDGAACGPGRECLQRTCQCTPASCSGCCQAGQCVTAPSRTACGAGGSACLDCGASACSGEQCAAALCNATNCPTGCCVGAQCQTGRDVNACGAAGRACASCGLGVCDGGTCEARCGPANCRGCCVGTTCVGGTDDRVCGRDGAACRNCDREDEECRSGACR
ncbi:MAG: hypothetical protein Q8S33_01150 [Myxococcales bacterium]|nr:hypothetical protein [Myxococcales bacterium]